MRVVNLTQSTAGSATYSITSRGGTTPQATIEAVGSTITVTIDGVLMITATGETLIPSAGKAGMYWDNGLVGDATGQLVADLAGEDVATEEPAEIIGEASGSLGTLAGEADGGVIVQGAASASLGAIDGGGAGSVHVQGGASASLGSLAVAAQGGPPALQGDTSVPLGTLSASATGSVAVAAGASISLGTLCATAAATGPRGRGPYRIEITLVSRSPRITLEDS
jgi:hypothetical protein